ncbi:RING-type domain-containing protein [Citrus sinensis]|uniref:RING-type domain-containing protein n=1 Tax=Citrus sinensis TaxID=2711 RepID=A0ACB8KKK3_CITSI|nr:RING-type domain-containing protein [Citrus sinensis]
MENKDQSGGSSSCSSENPNPCPICLGPVVEDSYLDKCFRTQKMFQSFMDMMELIFNGITLVKFLEIVSSFRKPTDTDYRAIIQNQVLISSSFDPLASDLLLSVGCILNDVFNVSRYWKSRKYLQSNQWLQSWLRREIQAVMQEEDVEIVVHHILGVVDSFLKRNKQRCQMGTPETKEEDFKALVSDAARPFLMARTDRFVNEMQLFLASALNIEAYDAVYMQRLGWNTPRVTMESGEGETSGQTPVIPYLHIFDEDSDGTD